MDGEKIHSSTGKRTESKFVWTSSNKNICIIAYAAPPIIPKSNWKQFDLLFRNKSFESLPQIFQLGHDQQMEEPSRNIDSIRKNPKKIHESLNQKLSSTVDPMKVINGNFKESYEETIVKCIKKTHHVSLLSNRYEPSDKFLDEINPNEAPSLNNLSRGFNQDDDFKQNLSMDEVWGKATDINTRKDISPKDVTSLGSFEEFENVKHNPFPFGRKLWSQKGRDYRHSYSELGDA